MKKKLGEMLVDAGLLTSEQLDQALFSIKKSEMKLGEFLVQGGGISEQQIVDMISRQLKVERYSQDRHSPDEILSAVISAEMANKWQVAPLRKKGSLLSIGTTDPTDIKKLDMIEEEIGIEVEAIFCTEEEINLLIMSIYGANTGLDGVLENMDEMQYRSDGDMDEESELTEDIDVNSLHNMAEDAPVVRLVNSIISQAVREGASDVHISPEKDSVQVRFRVDGKLHGVPAPPKYMILPILSRFKLLSNMDISISRIPQDGRFTVKMNRKEINIRASTIPTIYGENLVLRLLDSGSGIYELKSLGISDADRENVESMMVKPYGMILSTGPTGSGKTTTLYSILMQINTPDINIITLEDPVEYRIGKIRQTQLNERAGMTFASGIRSILRQDPDVIMVGEIRDPETASIAVQAALTGHRVLSTIHTNNAAGAITRFVDMKVDPFLIASVLLISIAQRLVRKVCQFCRRPYIPPRSILEFWQLEHTSDANFMQSVGCLNCMNTGYKGRTGIYEILLIDDMIQNLIIEGKSAQEISRVVWKAGKFKTLKENVAEKIHAGITTPDEAAHAIMA
ncbi:ATPase, T2SS/T4P/T4SS family [Desulfobacterales bacterium HSG16]|nr:ATPase, T2SS/T4P/T4SS family [Desulfobacterales bacterium HSG16]